MNVEVLCESMPLEDFVNKCISVLVEKGYLEKKQIYDGAELQEASERYVKDMIKVKL